MPKRIIECGDEDLEAFVASQNKLTVVEFWDPRCSICLEMAPLFSRLAKQYEGKVIFAKLNMKENEISPKKFQVYVTPEFIFFKNGKEVKRKGGLIGMKELRESIDQALSQF
ncbi:MAG: thioredoxin family protein [Candidatus Methanomethylicaceae archaeon]